MKVLGKICVSVLMSLLLAVGLSYCQSVADQSLSKGVEYAAQGKFKEAKEKFEEALKGDPTLEVAKGALQVIEDVTSKNIEKKTAIHFFKGALYVSKDQWAKAISEYNKALEINPRFAKAYYNRGLAYDENGQYDKAISDYEKAIGLNPRYAGLCRRQTPVRPGHL
jgi:tetratricopeptide (TPR) repeat protein